MADSASLGLARTLGFGAGIFFVLYLLFEILRRRLPDLYYWRNKATRYPEYCDYNGEPLGTAPLPGAFWPRVVVPYPEACIRESHGLDTALYLRFLATQAKIFAVLSVFTGVVLLPTYATAGHSKLPESHPNFTTGVQALSLANVEPSDNRLWVTLLADIAVVVFVCWLLQREISHYVNVRREYRASLNPANYAILVVDIPPEARNECAVRDLFDKAFPGDVEAVHIVRNAKALLAKKQKYLNMYAKKEALELKDQGTVEGDSPQDDLDVHSTHATVESVAAREQSRDRDDAGDTSDTPSQIDDLLEDVRAVQDDPDYCGQAPVTHAAFVVFKTKRAASLASTSSVWRNPSFFKVTRAPEPNAVNWDRIHISRQTSALRLVISLSVLLVITLFWFVPVTFIQGLSNLSKFAEQDGFAWLADFIDAAPGFAEFLESVLPPILLFVINLLVPLIFRFVLSFTRSMSKAKLDALVRNSLYVFYATSTFWQNVLAGSTLQAIETIVDKPDARVLLDLLSSTIPAQGTFFMKYVLLNAFLGAGLGVLNLGRLLFRPVFFASARTERQLRKAGAAMSEYPVFKLYSIGLMVALICTVYSTVAPLICLIGAFYFGIAYMCTKHTLLYSNVYPYQGGGFMFRDACTAMLINVYMHQIVMIGLFTLKATYTLVVISSLSLLGTLYFYFYLKRRFWTISKHGSLVDQVEIEEDREGGDVIPAHYAQLYIHPGLEPIEEVPVFGNGFVEENKNKRVM